MRTWLVAVIVTFINLAAAAYLLLRGNATLGVVMLLGAGAGLLLVFKLYRRGQ